MRKILSILINEPLTWFLGLALLIFAIDQHLNPETRSIIIDPARQQDIADRWAAQMGAAPSGEQLSALTEDWLIEELFYREALRLNLNENDLIVRRRLVQKYGFLVEQVPEQLLTETAIEDFYLANQARYEAPLRFSFEHILLSEQTDGPTALKKLQAGESPEDFGVNTLLPSRLTRKSATEVDFTFGPGFAAALNLDLSNQWQGPIRSPYGQHLIFITSSEPARTLALLEVFDKVQYDYIQSLKQAQRREAAEALKARYPVVYATTD